MTERLNMISFIQECFIMDLSVFYPNYLEKISFPINITNIQTIRSKVTQVSNSSENQNQKRMEAISRKFKLKHG